MSPIEDALHQRFTPSNEVMRYPKPLDYIPSKNYPDGHRFYGSHRCQAWNSRQGRQCLNVAIKGKRVCRVHGGLSRAGVVSPTFKHGRYSKSLPGRLLEKYGEVLKDKELLVQDESIRLMDVRISELLGRVDTHEAGMAWINAREALDALIQAIREKDEAGLTSSVNKLRKWIGEGSADYAAWHEINNTLELRRRLTESERKRVVELKMFITVEQAINLYKALVSSVAAHVKDIDTLSKIQNEFILLTNNIQAVEIES